VRTRALAALLLVGVPGPAAAGSGRGFWIEAEPADAGETAIRQALTERAFQGPRAQADALRQWAASQPGTLASGLALLAAGLYFVDAGATAEAVACLRHPDVARTPFADLAARGVGDALAATQDHAAAGASYVAAADALAGGPFACGALLRGADSLLEAQRPAEAARTFERASSMCPGREARILRGLADAHAARRDFRAEAAALDRLDAEFPTAPEARDAARRLVQLAALLPAATPTERAARALGRARKFEAARRYREALAAYRAAGAAKPPTLDLDGLRVRIGRCLLGIDRLRDAEAELAQVPAGSPHAAEAAFRLAQIQARRKRGVAGYEAVAKQFPTTAWAEEAWLALANHYQKDALHDEALPYFRNLLAQFPDGRHADRATWRVAWAEIRAGRYEDAAQFLERAARLRPTSWVVPGFLYWAARARAALREDDRSRALLEEVVRRYKYAYHGLRAQEALAQLPPAAQPLAAAAGPSASAAASALAAARGLAAPAPAAATDPPATRARLLLLIDRLSEAREELAALPPSPRVQATLAWIDWRQGRRRPAIIAMKKAYPDYIGEGGDRLPAEVWRILFPLEYSTLLQEKAAEEGLDPALVAAVICQESTFDPGAVSPAGARGLMQVMPRTGRTLARALSVRYRTQALHDPATSLDMGTRYLRDMLERYDGRVERALAAYNAGPHRVDAWTAGRPDVSAEEFVESIPFTETRSYVMTILASRENYRRLYPFPPAHAGSEVATAGNRP
jgi:soluble lytic murein transglycosylase